MLQFVIINSKWGESVVLRPLCAPLRHDTASNNCATQVCRNTTRQICVLLLQAPPFFTVPWRWYWFTKYSSLWNIQQTPQLRGLLNANLDFWVGATVQVVYTKYEIFKWKLNLSLPVRSRWNVQVICCIFSDISQSMQKMLVFINTSSSYVKFKFQQRWLWRILSSVTAWPLRTGLTVCPETAATNYQPTSRNIWEERRPEPRVPSRSGSMSIESYGVTSQTSLLDRWSVTASLHVHFVTEEVRNKIVDY